MDLRLHTLYSVGVESEDVYFPFNFFYFLDLDPFAEYRKHGVVLFSEGSFFISDAVKYYYGALKNPYPHIPSAKVKIKEVPLETLLTHEEPGYRKKGKELLTMKRSQRPIITVKK